MEVESVVLPFCIVAPLLSIAEVIVVCGASWDTVEIIEITDTVFEPALPTYSLSSAESKAGD